MSIFKQDSGSNKEWGEISTFGRTWLFVTEEIPVNTITLSLENPQFRMFEEGEADNTGGIQLTFEQAECLALQVSDLTGDVVATFDEPECTCTGTIVGVTGDLELNFVEPIFSMQAGLGVSCFFEPFEINMQEAVNMADMNAELKALDGVLSGGHTYVSMDLRMGKMDGEMYAGIHLTGTIENLTLNMVGMSGKVASMSAVGLPMTADLIGGPPPYIELELEGLIFSALGTPPESNSMTLTFRKSGISMTVREFRQAVLDARFNQMALSVDGKNHPVGSVSITFLPLSFAGDDGGHEVISAELDGRLSLLRMMADLHIDGPNSMDVEFAPHEISITDDGGDCALVDTLTYGG